MLLDASYPDPYSLAHLIYKNSASILPLMSTSALIISDILCCCRSCYFHYCDNCCAQKTIAYTHKPFKVYLCNLTEALFTTKLDWCHFCIKLLRQIIPLCYNESTISKKLVSSWINQSCFQNLRNRSYTYETLEEFDGQFEL